MTWKPIVAGIDGTPESARAAVVGSLVARRAGTGCTLVAAVPDYDKILAGFDEGQNLPAIAREARARDRETLTASLGGFVAPALIDAMEMRPGRPPIVLREAAERLRAGTIVVGHRRHHGLDRLRGSMVAHLLRSCDIPVLVARGGTPVIQRVLVGLDLSYASEPTLEAARQWAGLFGAALRAVHVIEPMPLLPEVTIQMSEEHYRQDERLREEGMWAQIGDLDVERVVRSGYPSTVLAAEAVEWNADLLVVGSHGHGWAERLLVGCTAEHLLHRPPTMTLVIPVGLPAVDRPLDVALPWEAKARGAHATV